MPCIAAEPLADQDQLFISTLITALLDAIAQFLLCSSASRPRACKHPCMHRRAFPARCVSFVLLPLSLNSSLLPLGFRRGTGW